MIPRLVASQSAYISGMRITPRYCCGCDLGTGDRVNLEEPFRRQIVPGPRCPVQLTINLHQTGRVLAQSAKLPAPRPARAPFCQRSNHQRRVLVQGSHDAVPGWRSAYQRASIRISALDDGAKAALCLDAGGSSPLPPAAAASHRPRRYPSRPLSEICERMNVPVPRAHSSPSASTVRFGHGKRALRKSTALGTRRCASAW